MKYVGLYTQQTSNNVKSMALLACFPLIMLGMLYAFLAIRDAFINWKNEEMGEGQWVTDWDSVNLEFLSLMPIVVGVVAVWFLIAYFLNASLVRRATGARPLERRENPRVYNIVENLTMTCGMPMPKINVIDDPMLNAFASGIDNNSYTVTVTTGICDRLNDDELAGVIGHELTHIRNNDTRLLIISIVFVGIMSTIMQMAVRGIWHTLWFGDRRSSSDRKGSGGGAGILLAFSLAAILATIGYISTILVRFAISRKREYMADAGGAELCGNPLALASALRKISGHTALGNVDREDIAQLYICRPKFSSGISSVVGELLSTHPSIEKRIAYLEQF